MGGTAARQRTAAKAAIGGALAITLSLALATAAEAVSPPSPWNGVNPFRCTIQDAGQGNTVPDPGADPYCVHFDKSQQNVTELGLIAFLTQEPARFSSAAPKCFYYQEDHWRGSVIQSNQQTLIYEFYGHYFFNKATGDGGVWVTGFTLAGQTFDPRNLPGFPPQYDQYYGPGTGGFITHNDVPTDPNCAARAQRTPGAVYAGRGTRCLDLRGRVDRHNLGPVNLGMPERRVKARLGPPQADRRGYLRYCVAAGGQLLVGTAPGRAHRALILLTTSQRFAVTGHGGRTVSVKTPSNGLRKAFPRARRIAHVGRAVVFLLRPPRDADDHRTFGGAVIAGVVHGHVAYLATYNPRAVPSGQALVSYLKRAR